MSTWTNEDGLLVRFGTTRSEVAVDGSESAEENILEVAITFADVADTDTAAVAGDRPYIPAGAIVREAIFVVDTAFSGSTSVLDIGLKQLDGTNIADDGIDSLAEAVLLVRAGIEADGALVGTKMQYDCYPMFTFDTAAFTAGAGRLRLKYEV